MSVTVAGAGMSGLCAAARLRELGAEPVVLEKGERPGGSMLLSSCVIWRHREWNDFRAECPGGDEAVQRAVWEGFDEALAWLESLGAPVIEHETGNPRTVGKRFDPAGLTRLLSDKAGEIRLRARLRNVDGPLILATGGFGGDVGLVARYIQPAGELLQRANRWSTGDGLRYGLDRGGAVSAGMAEFYGRNMPVTPARINEEGFVPLAQLYGRYAFVVDEAGTPFAPEPLSWSENDLVQATARRPGARAWYLVDARALNEAVSGRTVESMVAAAEAAGGKVRRADSLAMLAEAIGVASLPESEKLVSAPFSAVHVVPGITHTIGGLQIDERARVLDEDGAPIEGLYAAGVDAGGVATGGYASGLASALVLGRVAAQEAAT